MGDKRPHEGPRDELASPQRPRLTDPEAVAEPEAVVETETPDVTAGVAVVAVDEVPPCSPAAMDEDAGAEVADAGAEDTEVMDAGAEDEDAGAEDEDAGAEVASTEPTSPTSPVAVTVIPVIPSRNTVLRGLVSNGAEASISAAPWHGSEVAWVVSGSRQQRSSPRLRRASPK